MHDAPQQSASASPTTALDSIKAGSFYFVVAANWLFASLIAFLPTNQYVWMRDEYGKDTPLPEDHSGLGLMVALLAYASLMVACASGLFGWGILPRNRARRAWVVAALAPALAMLLKLASAD